MENHKIVDRKMLASITGGCTPVKDEFPVPFLEQERVSIQEMIRRLKIIH